ncbi:MAG: winged helix-turn-helix transcriptional regulator [Dehalococcoidia bacterium]|nr:winged helix-turn-helix transcriptional regulator [Dehalococcoidia bacterium]
MPIVALLYGSGCQPFSELAGRLSASRDTLTDTLSKLEASGVVARQHPGRKTMYVLTPLGEKVGAECVPLVQLIANTDVFAIALKKWPMLVAVALGRGARRYGEARAALPGITARALAMALKDLEAAGVVERTVESGYPPAPAYELSPKGMAFFPALDALCHACESAVAT